MKNRIVRSGAAVLIAAGLTLGAAAPAQAFSWFGSGYTYPSHSEWKVPTCSGFGGFRAFFDRNFDSHLGDLNNFTATAGGIYSDTFGSASGLFTSLAYTSTQPLNFVTYPTLDLLGHAAFTLFGRC